VDFLDDKVLEAEFTDGDVQFSLYVQPDEPPAGGEGA